MKNRRLSFPAILSGLGIAAVLSFGPLAACGSDPVDVAGDAGPPASVEGAPRPVDTTVPPETSSPETTPETTSETSPETTEAHHHHDSTDSTVPSNDNGDGVLDFTATEYSFAAETDIVPAGLVPVRLNNGGVEPHQLQIGRLPGGVDADAFLQSYETDGEAVRVHIPTWAGGVNGLAPGASGTAEVELQPGEYIVVCFFPAPDGTSHLHKHMITTLHVVADGSSPVVPPNVSEVVTLQEYAINLPPGFRGDGTIAFANVGTENHEVVLVRLKEGKTLADAAAFNQTGQGEPPYTFAGGIGSIAPGTTGYADLHLSAGSYIAVCFVPGPAGAPHVDMGMIAPFEVS